ncbi:protein naked cuticle homolog 2 [Leptodactylus fuscus]|uniref:protein naked cuticle homolog 2 n=1 Tax=Leptodactylus fuscus TaxID=238119 RepID=UPI003F4E68A9
MGKLHSKHASNRRENPEGDSFVVNSYINRKGFDGCERFMGLESKLKNGHEELIAGVSEDGLDDLFALEVNLPPKKREGLDQNIYSNLSDDAEKPLIKEATKRSGKKQINIDELECNVSVKEDNHQEWTFTLYDFDNSGKVTKEDMSSLMHTIYEVVDQSVNHSSNNSKTLRVKLTVSPESSAKKRENSCASQEKEGLRPQHSEEIKIADKRLSGHVRRNLGEQRSCNENGDHYCVDENTERRNHYLDLAGIENYMSRFDSGLTDEHAKQEQYKSPHFQSKSRPQESDTQPVHHRRSQVFYDYSVPLVEPMPRLPEMQQRNRNQDKQFIKSPKGCGKPPTIPSGLSGGKPGKGMNYTMPVSPSHAVQSAQEMYLLQQQPYNHKRYRQKSKDMHSPLKTNHSQPAVEHEFIRDFPPVLTNEGYVVPVIQRHEHHHHHDHHHHHHYHHYYQ